MSSPGLKIFISVMRKFDGTNNKLLLSNLNSIIKKILEIVELTEILDIYTTEEEALESLKEA